MSTHAAEVAKGSVMRPVRKPNAEYRVREHLTESEIEKLLAALRRNRNGQRDWLIGLMIYRHGLRVSEACDLRWDGYRSCCADHCHSEAQGIEGQHPLP
jgi:integrase